MATGTQTQGITNKLVFPTKSKREEEKEDTKIRELKGDRNSTFKVESLEPAYAEIIRMIEFLKPRHKLLKEKKIVPFIVDSKKFCYAWYCEENWETPNGNASEMRLSVDLLSKSGIEIMTQIDHELIHAHNDNIWPKRQDSEGNKFPADMSREGCMHNQKFRDTARNVGGECEDPAIRKQRGSRDIGWGMYSFLPKILTEIETEFKPNEEAFSLIRHDIKTKPKSKTPTKMIKYTCMCGTNVRCATGLDATCNKCHEVFFEEVK